MPFKNHYMNFFKFQFCIFFLFIFFIGCKKNDINTINSNKKVSNQIQYAKGLSIYKYNGFSILKVTKPWPDAKKEYTYILKEENQIVPDSLKQFSIISVPIKSIVVTSTTHIPSLEMLGVENTLVGFPNLNYISSDKVRARIDAGKIREIGNNESLNTEVVIDMQPNVVVGYGIDNNNPSIDNLEKNGLEVLLNGDWNEQTPLGKAEWIKFFGALFNKQIQADTIFKKIENDYKNTINLAKSVTKKPTVLLGDIYEGKWYLPNGNSWGCQLIKEAKGNYLWSSTTGTGSLSLSFETVFEKAKEAQIWITSGQFSTLSEMNNANPHYAEFTAFKNKKVYSLVTQKGKKGGVLYYELGPNRPDIVLKDLLKILHPELLPNYELFFFEQLK